MEHIVQFAISIDDQTIQKRLEENAYNDICNRLVEEANNYLGTGYHQKKISWMEITDACMDAFIEEHKDEIINAAAEKLKDSFCRTKAYKEKMKEVLD